MNPSNRQKVLILGTTGMLGHECAKVLSSSQRIDTIQSSRTNLPSTNQVQFEVGNSLSKLDDLGRLDYIVNCIGVIKPHISEHSPNSIENAIRINSLFPFELEKFAQERSIKIIQIATDCVFSGNAKDYSETSAHDALDVYGKSKSLGEVRSDIFMNLRCSIIGRELKSKFSLLEWVMSQKQNSEVAGFLNHYWNGLTTMHFALIVRGIIEKDFFFPGLQHIVPADTVSKRELIEYLRLSFGREDLRVKPQVTDKSINRALRTLSEDTNVALWQHAGFSKPPTVQQMVSEYANYL